MHLQPVIRFFEHMIYAGHWKGHGVHSPFFFDIINTLSRNKTKSALVYKRAEARRKELINNRSMIPVTDYGTGISRYRKVSDIASGSAIRKKDGLLLAFFASRAGERPIIEFGTSLGVGTYYLALANSRARIITVEGCPMISRIALSGFEKAGFANIELINGEFDTVAERITDDIEPPGLVFIDGNHKGEALKRYFEIFARLANHETVIIVDDINYTSDMSSAWSEIKNDSRVTGSIDTGKMGVLFFTRGVSTHHYRILY